MKNEINEMIASVARDFDGMRYEVDVLDSGVVMVDIWRHGKFLVMCYDPEVGFGADLVKASDKENLFDNSYTPAGKTIREAESRLRLLLASV